MQNPVQFFVSKDWALFVGDRQTFPTDTLPFKVLPRDHFHFKSFAGGDDSVCFGGTR